MTCEEFRAKLRLLGLVRVGRAYAGGTLYSDREGQFTTIPDPEELSEEERQDVMDGVMFRMGITEH